MVKIMKSNIDLSIIIPVYNGEEYLERCLKSIVTQLNDKTEVIIVDDGSTDKSKNIYTKFTEKYHNVFAYFKNNGGVSSARNLGIRKSKGKYLTFIDGDDFVSDNFIERLLREIKDDIDVLFFQYGSDDVMDNSFNISKTITKEIENDVIIKSSFLAKEPIENHKYNFRAVWSKAIKRKIVEDNNILFPENIYFGEDMVFMLNVYSNMKTKKFISDVLYHNFFLHETSATNRYKPEMINVLKKQANSIKEWLNKYKLPQYNNYHYLYRLNDIILLLKYDFFHKKNRENEKIKKQRFKETMINYKDYYAIVKNYNLLHFYKLSKRLIIYICVNNHYYLAKMITKIKYNK